jgi:hypothetical protein
VITRTVTAQVELTFQVQQALGLNESLASLGKGITVSGSTYAVRASGSVTLISGSNITGAVAASNFSQNSGSIFSGTTYSAPATAPAPSAANLNHYATYVYQGNTYSAVPLSSGTLTTTTLPAYHAATNPLNVFYYNGNITVTSAINFSGTLVAVNGNFIVDSAGSTITAMATMPALVIDKSLEVKSTNQSLTVNGAVYAGSGIATGGGTNTGCQLVINGGLMINSGSITPPSGTTLNVTYDAANVSAPALSSTPNAVQLVSWSQ